jgi:hypothetical protein
MAVPLAKELSWADLVPDQPAIEDPFASLTSDQLHDLSLVARVRGRLAAGRPPTPATRAEAADLEAALVAQGVDVDDLLARRAEITEKRRAAAEGIVPALNGQQIRMPGYLLPLEFDGTAAIEFLLVPYVGACIHVPPPPPNQIVYVRFDDGYENPGLFTPVWVEGSLVVDISEKNLYLVDGTADVAVGYSLSAIEVEPYVE